MKLFRDLSISTKHAILAMATTGIMVVLCGGEFLIDGMSTLKEFRSREVQSAAQLLAVHSATLMSDQDGQLDEAFSSAIETQPTVSAAALYDSEGRLKTQSNRGATVAVFPAILPARSDATKEIAQNGLIVQKPIVANGHQIGTLLLKTSEGHLWAQSLQAFRGLALVLAISLLVGFVLMSYLHRRISRPLIELASTASRISQNDDYSMRVAWNSKDEIGKLYHAFNHFLNTVQTFRHALEDARDDLENRVQERTARLRREVSSRRKAQLELIRARDQAETANRAKSMFLANMSHEIRTPLNTILGFTDLLRREVVPDLPEHWSEHLEMIHSSGQHLLELINDVLDLSKIEVGQLDVERVPCSPHAIIAQVISFCRIAALAKHLTLRYRWIGKIPNTIETDPARFRQLLVNLIGNAIKFTEFGSVSIIAELKRDIPPRLVVQVIDSGIGIPEDKQRLIFEPFTQVDDSVTREYGGTGLGLSICKWITEQLGGDLKVDSALGEGSTFTVSIDPGSLENTHFLKTSHELIKPTDSLIPPTDLGLPVLPSDLRILVVEDGSSNRKLLKLLLTKAGAEVITAENGKIGLEKAVSEKTDLILMDMQMPVMDGYIATPRIRQAGIRTPIIALTAHAMKGDRQKCLDVGCNGYVSKPIDSKALIQTICDTLNIPQTPPSEEKPSLTEKTMHQTSLYSELPTFDPEFREIVEDFVEKLRVKLSLMQDRLAACDGESLWEEAHWLKGSGGTAGFPVFTAPASRLCEAARAKDWNRAELAMTEIADYTARIDVHSDVILNTRARASKKEIGQ